MNRLVTVKSKLAKCVSIMYKAKLVLHSEALQMLHNSLFQPYLNYCSEVWANTYKSRLKCISVIQKRAIRLICNVSSRTHTTDLFKEMKIFKFIDLVEYKCGMLMFKAYNNKLPTNLQKLFNIGNQTSNYKTRQQKKFLVRFRRTNIMAHCTSSVGVKIWNSLPKFVTEAKSLHMFKNIYKNYIISRY